LRKTIVAQQKVRINFPKGYRFNSVDRLAIGREILEFIRDRTEKGLDKDNKKFKKSKKGPHKGDYTKSYANSLDFKNAGKSTTPINLALSGDMMASIKLLSWDRSGGVTIGLDSGDPDEGKLEGNRKGTYGNSRAVAPKRDPLGITPEDLKSILDKFDTRPTQTRREVEAARQNLERALEPIARSDARRGALPDITLDLDLSDVRRIRNEVRDRISSISDESEDDQ
jgi:hypothetical protein